MSREPLSSRGRSILIVLWDEQEDLARDLDPRTIHKRAFGSDTRFGRTKVDLERLAGRALVERTDSGDYRLTHKGEEAIRG